VNKIPELTQEQFNQLKDIISDFKHRNITYTELYLEILKIADAQGLLTKEASLALKPENWIEWDNTSTTCHSYGKTKVNVSFIIFYNAETGYTVNSLADNKGHKKIGVFDTGQECIDCCQKYLDEYLKGCNG